MPDNVISPISDTVLLQNAHIGELEKAIGNKAESVQMTVGAKLPYGNCYWNVAEVVERSGGSLQLGWMLLQWPSKYLVAEHHAVWKRTDGKLVDVTAKPTSDRFRDRTTFVRDESIAVDLHRVPNVRSRHHLLDGNPKVMAVMDAYFEKHAIYDAIIEVHFRLGYRCENQVRLAKGLGPTGMSISTATEDAKRLMALMQEEDAIMRRLGTAITALRAAR